ncbi:MAG: cyclic nucleotide-binding/CBS domain-containing protein [bacterium]
MDSATLRSPINILNPPKPICVEYGTKVKEVIEIMQENRCGCVCVVDQEKLVGIFTERDVLKKVVGHRKGLQDINIEEVMSPNPEYLYEDDEIAFALNRMHVGGFRHVPLINLDGKPVAVISVKDIVAHLMKSLDVKVQ